MNLIEYFCLFEHYLSDYSVIILVQLFKPDYLVNSSENHLSLNITHSFPHMFVNRLSIVS